MSMNKTIRDFYFPEASYSNLSRSERKQFLNDLHKRFLFDFIKFFVVMLSDVFFIYYHTWVAGLTFILTLYQLVRVLSYIGLESYIGDYWTNQEWEDALFSKDGKGMFTGFKQPVHRPHRQRSAGAHLEERRNRNDVDDYSLPTASSYIDTEAATSSRECVSYSSPTSCDSGSSSGWESCDSGSSSGWD